MKEILVSARQQKFSVKTIGFRFHVCDKIEPYLKCIYQTIIPIAYLQVY